MSATSFSIPVLYLRQLAAALEALAVDVPAWLRAAGLAPERLDDPTLELPLERFERLVVDAVARSEEPALGLLVGRRLQLHAHGALGFAALSAGSLRQALELFQAFARVRFPLVAVAVEERADGVRLRVTETVPLGRARGPVLEAVLLAIRNALDALAPGTLRLRRACFAFPAPTHAPLARELFGCEVSHGARFHGLVLARDSLDAPRTASDPAALREALQICERELARLTERETFAGRVRQLLLERQPGFPSLELAARLLRLTPRTLHRRLVAEGTSFRALLDEVRHRLAVQQLTIEGLRVEDLAHALGYSDLANFRRAFKRWEGVPPAAFRARHRRRRAPKRAR